MQPAKSVLCSCSLQFAMWLSCELDSEKSVCRLPEFSAIVQGENSGARTPGRGRRLRLSRKPQARSTCGAASNASIAGTWAVRAGAALEAHKQRLLRCAELEGVLHGAQVAVVVKVGGVVRAAHAGPAQRVWAA